MEVHERGSVSLLNHREVKDMGQKFRPKGVRGQDITETWW